MTVEARVDMPTEDTTLLQEGEDTSLRASKRAKKVAGTMLCMFGALAVVSSATSGSMRPIPQSFQDFKDHMPTWSFLALVLLHSVREFISGPDWSMGPGLTLYCFSLPYVISQGSAVGNSIQATVVQVGVIAGVVAMVLDQLRSGNTPASWQKLLNCAACGAVVVGTTWAIAVKVTNAMDSLPFIAWATTACAFLFSIMTNGNMKGFNHALWLLVLYSAAQVSGEANAATGGTNLNATLMEVACMGGAAFSVISVLDLFPASLQSLLVSVTYGAIFVPLCLTTIQNFTLDIHVILQNIATYTFAVILGVRAILCLLCSFMDGPSADDRTDGFVWLFVLCLVLQLRAMLSAVGGESTSFSKYAGDLAQAGPALGLVVFILSLLGKFESELTKLRQLACFITIVGILLS